MDAHAKEGSDVDIVTHKVFRCFFNVSSGMTGWKKCVEEHTHAHNLSLMSYLDVILQQQRITNCSGIFLGHAESKNMKEIF